MSEPSPFEDRTAIGSRLPTELLLARKQFDEHEFRIKNEARLRFIVTLVVLFSGVFMIFGSFLLLFLGFSDRLIALALSSLGTMMILSQYALSIKSADYRDQVRTTSRSKYFDELSK